MHSICKLVNAVASQQRCGYYYLQKFDRHFKVGLGKLSWHIGYVLTNNRCLQPGGLSLRVNRYWQPWESSHYNRRKDCLGRGFCPSQILKGNNERWRALLLPPLFFLKKNKVVKQKKKKRKEKRNREKAPQALGRMRRIPTGPEMFKSREYLVSKWSP